MVNVEVEVDAVAEVIGGGEGAEAAGESVEAVKGEEFDDEGEIGGNGIRVLNWASESEIKVELRG